MRRLFGKKDKRKKLRVSPSARTPEGLVQSHPMYQYALNEYAQTVAPEGSNGNGRLDTFSQSQIGSPVGGSDSGVFDLPQQTQASHDDSKAQPQQEINQGASLDSGVAVESIPTLGSTSIPTASSPQREYVLNDPSQYASWKKPPPPQRQPIKNWPRNTYNHLLSSYDEPVMPDSTYEESYGDAYIGGHIRYVYPSGYQSMRPRGGPWKLSMLVCLSFTWLSVFVIDHCSEPVNQSEYNKYEIDDDTLAIETRWCGSRMLYMMWVISMLITGMASAYCGVIGYIKLRDFAVANCRSQPPGMVGKSDYYVSLGDSSHHYRGTDDPESGEDEQYRRTIYQADGTPQFWGGHIYRPTQAAVAVTSR